MKIIKFPHPNLFIPCTEVTVFGDELKILLETMFLTMKKHKGIGLASNQVGLNFRMFVMIGPEDEKIFLVNPKIVSRSSQPANLREGCLSAPGEYLELKERAAWVKVEYQDETGKNETKVFKELHAVCVQHEIDHLDGKSHLQSKSIPRAKRREIARKWGIK